jgi:cytosine/adenosine deaminase-related metal-dependent hydrolase
MIVRARTVVTMAGDPIENGAVFVRGNKIVGVGRFDDLRRDHSGDLLDLGERVLLPGLVNAHCHLDYTILRGKIGPHRSFADWIRAINAEKAKLTEQNYIDSISAGFVEAERFGTTTIANLTAFPNLLAAIREPVRTWWFGELFDVRNPEQADQIVDEAVENLCSVSRWGLAPHAPFTASPRLYARCEEIARQRDALLTTHLAESRDEMLMFRDGTGPTFDFLKSIGRPTDDCGRETPVARFLQARTIDDRWIIAHLNELDAGDYDVLQTAPKFHIAHCPRSHSFFQHAPFALERLRSLGFNICLGTDSLASNSDLSLFSEMRELLRAHPSVSPRETLEMVTTNGAAALQQPDCLGRLVPGAYADMIAVRVPAAGDIYENIAAFSGNVPWVMVNGEIKENAA